MFQHFNLNIHKSSDFEQKHAAGLNLRQEQFVDILFLSFLLQRFGLWQRFLLYIYSTAV